MGLLCHIPSLRPVVTGALLFLSQLRVYRIRLLRALALPLFM
jgi:hypothetical protein